MPEAGKDYRGSSSCFLSGWGLVQTNPPTLKDRLQKVSKRLNFYNKSAYPAGASDDLVTVNYNEHPVQTIFQPF